MTTPAPANDSTPTNGSDSILPQRSPGATRRSLALATIVSLTVIGGGVVASGQFAGASAPNGTAVPSTNESEPAPDVEIDDEGIEIEAVEITPEIAAQFERFDACMNEQLGDDRYPIFDVDEIDFDDVELGDIAFDHLGEDAFEVDWNGGVFVETGNLAELGEFIEFGDGDATITISKTGDEVSVVVDGDAATVELFDADDAATVDVLLTDDDLDAGAWAEFDAAAERCDALFPAEFDDLGAGSAPDED